MSRTIIIIIIIKTTHSKYTESVAVSVLQVSSRGRHNIMLELQEKPKGELLRLVYLLQ